MTTLTPPTAFFIGAFEVPAHIVTPAAAAELAKKRAHQSQATKKSRQKMYEEATTGNPEAVERYENYLVTRRKSYHRKKQEAERTA